MHTLLAPPVAPPPTASAANSELALMLLGPSAAMSTLWSQVRRLAAHVRTVLLTGSADCGQEAVARLLLDLSHHPQRPFLTLKGPEAENRLAHLCHLQAAPGAQFFYLPDVHHLSADGQRSLLKLLYTHRSRGLSIITSTDEDLRSMASVGRFSLELAELLATVRIAVPLLKERAEDLPMLLGQVLPLRWDRSRGHAPQLSEEFLRTAMQHPWTGNFRELFAMTGALLADAAAGRELRSADLLRALGEVQLPQSSPGHPARMVKLDMVVHEHIYSVLRGCRGNKLKAAEVLGISRSTLYRMLESATLNASLPLSV